MEKAEVEKELGAAKTGDFSKGHVKVRHPI